MARFDRALAAEFAGTAALMAGLVAVSALAPSIAPDRPATQLLVVSTATGFLLVALMQWSKTFGGGFLNPIVSFAVEVHERPRYEWMPAAALFLLVQFAGGICGAWLADAALASAGVPVATPNPPISGNLAEAVAGGSIALVAYLAPVRKRIVLLSAFSGLLYWFTDSVGFGNPAVTISRAVATVAFGLDGTAAAVRALAQVVGALVMITLLAVVFRDKGPAPTGEEAGRTRSR